jgi:hypothetical protein
MELALFASLNGGSCGSITRRGTLAKSDPDLKMEKRSNWLCAAIRQAFSHSRRDYLDAQTICTALSSITFVTSACGAALG